MIIKKRSYPWKYVIVDDFIEESNFYKIQHEAYNIFTDKDNGKKRGQFYLNEENWISSTLFNQLKLVCDKLKLDINFNSYYHQCELSVCQPEYDYDKIHTDVIYKKLTAVLYLSDTGTGTDLYYSSSKDSFAKTVHWKPNRVVLFQRTPHTWHNFHSLGCSENRYTINLVLREYD